MTKSKQVNELELMGSAVQQQYEDILNHKRNIGLMKTMAEAEKMYAGDQWPAATAATKNLPRPVLNITSQIVNHKIASVMNENVRMVFTAQDSAEDSPEVEGANLFTKYSDTKWEELKQADLNENVLLTAAITGTGIFHYYWDNDVEGGNVLNYKGDIAAEEIDPINFFPCNMQEPDIEKQPYFLITSRVEAAKAREIAKQNGLPPELIELIQGDGKQQDQAYEMAKREIKGHEMTTIITKYWKDNGQVKFLKVASGIVIKPEAYVGANGQAFTRYPVVSFQWNKRKKSFFGRGDVESIMPNQKAINLIIAMHILSIQNVAFPKILAIPSRLISPLTNQAGEVIQTQEGAEDPVKYLQPPSVPSDVSNFVNELMGQTKDVAGANENALGEQSGGQLNATAIMQLQKAAGVPLETIRRRIYNALESIGKVWEQFYKIYFDLDRNIVIKNDEGKEEVTQFNGSQYANTNMNLKIDIGPASGYSEQMMMTSLDKFLDTQQITFEDYLEFVPQNVVPFKDQLLKKIQERNDMMAQQQAMQEQQMMAQQQADQEAMAQQQQMEMQAQSEQQAIEEEHRKEELALQNKKLNIETLKALGINKGDKSKHE